jgi:hypothetical protein
MTPQLTMLTACGPEPSGILACALVVADQVLAVALVTSMG